jgi:hypothetical protein
MENMLKSFLLVKSWWPSWMCDRHKNNKLGNYFYNVAIPSAENFLTRRFFKVSTNQNTLLALAAKI